MTVPASAGAEQVGVAHGVRAVKVHGDVAFVFTSKASRLWKRVSGHEVSVECDGVPSLVPAPNPLPDASEGLKVPKRGRRIVTGLHAGVYDTCRIWREPSRARVLAISLTQAGADFLDEVHRTDGMLGVLDRADGMSVGGRFPAAPDLVAQLKGAAVALANPSDSPPAGKYGVYSDADRHIEIVALSAAGRRLFVDVNADTFSANVLPQITFELD